MKKLTFLALILAFVMPFAAFAQQAQTPSVGEQLQAELAKMNDVEKAQALATLKDGPSASAAKAREWIDIGNGIGTGLATTAGKLGVEVNKFAQTPVGKMAMFLILWNYLGDTLIHLFGALFCLIILFGWWRVYRRMFGEFNEKGKLVRLTFRNSASETAFFMTAIGCVISVAGFVTVVTT
jgi:hypothetical protein